MKTEEKFVLNNFFSFDSFMIMIYIIWRGYYEFKPDASFFKGSAQIPGSETLSASWMIFGCRGVELEVRAGSNVPPPPAASTTRTTILADSNNSGGQPAHLVYLERLKRLVLSLFHFFSLAWEYHIIQSILAWNAIWKPSEGTFQVESCKRFANSGPRKPDNITVSIPM